MSTTNDEVIAKLLEVADAKSFLAFVRAVIADREAAARLESMQPSPPYGTDAGGWENVRIETYLEAAAAWAESTDFGVSQGLDPHDLWRRFAQFLAVGKVYE